MNKLDEIIEQNWDKIFLDLHQSEINKIKSIALEFAKHILEEAAENSFVSPVIGSHFENEVNKQSITDTINKYL